ncbi:MbtH family protein [Escherichia fergusonii]|uniref:MbtH family protein n=1 Tax=Escherichia fergusonii TaxID=564 RepID=UPI001CC16A6B|nr:MbtH family protein [Escherichia fergusonii]MBZ4074802.1 MbtH family protein [Escherichia fergusonii]MBZ4108529.1 MbtH family protein [Escherichia fergusonii]MBZ4111847.1 MbtH family protein [Escherichia fergusonii]MBZ4122117.1 MbtH family protein [Escherichia fergusonii]MBZ4127581.1 MbtH family protein [Escherichia fergusonii]
MAFSNPFDDPQGVFYILRNAQGQFSLWPQQCALPAGWDVVCQPQLQASCQQWLDAHWRTLTPANFIQQQEAQ